MKSTPLMGIITAPILMVELQESAGELIGQGCQRIAGSSGDIASTARSGPFSWL